MQYELINTPEWQPTEENVRTLLKDLKDKTDGDSRYNSRYSENTTMDVGSGWSVTLAECKGGGEGDGEEHWLVYKLEKASQETYWKVPGWYQSYHGAELEWDNTFQVKAVEKVITVWEKK